MAAGNQTVRVVPSAARRMTASVRARSTIAATAVILLGSIVGSALLLFLLQRALISTVEDNAATRASEVANLVAGSDSIAVQRDLVQNTNVNQVIQVIGPGDAIIASSDVRAGTQPLSRLRPQAGVVLREQRSALALLRTKDPYLITVRGVTHNGSEQTVLVATTIASQRESIERLITYLLVLIPLSGILVALVTWVVVGRALRPVESIRARVAAIRAGRLADRVPVPRSHDEVARLATTMNEMLERLEDAQAVQRGFVSDASHELRSPLATLTASLEVVGEQPTPETWHDMRTVMTSEVDRMSRLVDDLLLLAKVDDQGWQIASEDVDLDDIADHEVRRLRAGSEVTVSTSIVPVRIRGDRDRLAQVVRNIVDNSAIAARSTIHVSVMYEFDAALIRVEDDGPGITQADRERVFERFVRLDSSRSRDSGGSGLGLAIVREIVLRHGGSVDIGDSELGGARVDVRLPRQRPSEDEARHPPSGSSR